MRTIVLPPHDTLGALPIAKPIKKIKVANYSWLQTTREFYRWKKTDKYKDWRKRQFGRQRGLCFYCDKSLIGVRTNVEHINPRSRGGKNSLRNLVLSCWECNKNKGSKPLSSKAKRDFRAKHDTKRLAYKEEIELAAELHRRVWGEGVSEFVKL